MFGDFGQFISRIIKQQITCKHDYYYDFMKEYPFRDYQVCRKCGKWKW